MTSIYWSILLTWWQSWSVLLTLWQSCCLSQELTTWYQDLQFVNKMPARFTASWEGLPVDVPGDCALVCLKQNGCQGFFYQEVSKTCKTSSRRYLIDSDEVVAPGYRYFRRQQASCPNSSVLHMPTQTCFRIYDHEALTWTIARHQCASLGGRLAVLDTRAKVAFFMAYVTSGGVTRAHYHLGGCRPYDKWLSYPQGGVPDFKWLSGVLLDWDYYKQAGYSVSSEPNYMDTETTVSVFYDYGMFSIGNVPNLAVARYVCEFSLF